MRAIANQKGINLPQAKKRNLSLIKEVIYQYAPISRMEISEILSLTPATITNNVNLLIETGLVHEVVSIGSANETTVGRKPIMLSYIQDARYAFGIEISPRGFFYLLCNLNGEVIKKGRIRMDHKDFTECLAGIEKTVNALKSEYNLSLDKIAGLGLGLPGFIDQKTGYLRNNVWISWKNRDIKKELTQCLGMPVCIDNNATVRAISEGFLEKNRPASFAYLFISRGIACPIMIQNSALSHKVAGAGEIGHMAIDIHGDKCDWCGDYGCLNTFTGETGIRRKCAAALSKNTESIMKLSAVNPENPTIEEIYAAAEQEDAMVWEILDQAARYLAIGICNVIKFISPELVVVDAYIMGLEKLRHKFLNYIDQHLAEGRWGDVKFVFKDFDEYSGAVGAAGYAIKSFVIEN